MAELEITNTPQNSLVKLFLDRFFVVLSLAYVIGIILVRLWFEEGTGVYLLFALIVGLLFAIIFFRLLDFYRVILILVAMAAGGIAFFYALQQPVSGLISFSGSPLYVEGTVADEPLFHEDYSAYRLNVDLVETGQGRFSVSGTLLVKLYGADNDSYRFGERLGLRGEIVEPRGQRNPGGFDYRYYLRSQGIDALIYPLPAQVSSIGAGSVSKITASAISLRSALIKAIEANLPSPSAELLAAILFGQRERLPEEIELNFRQAGVGHLMAVSGLHVGLVAALILGLGRLCNLRGSVFLVTAIIAVFAYAYLTGMRPSALRAAVMVSLVLAALILDRERDLPIAVSFAALLTLFLNPLLLFTVGFQLSYVATLSIFYASSPLEQSLKASRCPTFLRTLLAVTLAAQLGVLPLSVYYFQHLPLGGIFFNLLLLPLMALLVGLGLTGAMLGLVFTLPGAIVLWAARPLLEIMLYVTALSNLPGLSRPVYPPGLLFIYLYYGLMVLFLTLYYRWKDYVEKVEGLRKKFFLHASTVKKRLSLWLLGGLVLGSAVVILWVGIIFPTDNDLTVTFLDVGQGAAALIETPCNVVIMVDAGGEPAFRGNPGRVGETVLLPYFRHRGIRNIDLAIITHPHEDHFGGFIPLLDALVLDAILISPAEGNSDYYLDLLNRAEERQIKVREAAAGQRWQCGDQVVLEIIAPPEKLFSGTGSDLNNNSIVFILHYGLVRLLFTGDIEDVAVNDLLRRDLDLKADLLLIPHHGGYLAAMPDFLEAVDPSLAVIQVGKNSFGHPHPFVVDAIEMAGIELYRNDQHGAVIFRTDGREMSVLTVEKTIPLMP